MTKRYRRSILCRPRRGRCCLGGAVFVVLHFRHLRIALSSAEAMRGVSANTQRLSPNQALHLSSVKAEQQTHRCCAVSSSSPQNLPSAESCLPISARQLLRAVWWPHLKREIYILLSWQLTPSSSSRFLVRSLVFSEEIVARDPQNLHEPALLSQCSQDAPQFSQSSLSPSFALTRDSLSVTRATSPVSSRRACYLAASFAATVSASKELYLAAAVATHEHSLSPLFSTTTPAPLPPSAPRTHSHQRYTLIISTAFC